MGKGINGAVLRALGARNHVLTVVDKSYLANRYVRVRLHSDTLFEEAPATAGDFVRAWFPDPAGSKKEFERAYTIRNADEQTRTFDIDFLVHEPHGPAAQWAMSCAPGDNIDSTRYGRVPFKLVEPEPRGYLFLGDPSSYPAIMDLAELIPAHIPVVIYLEAELPEDQLLPLPIGPNITAAWVDKLPAAQALVQAIDGRDWTGWYAWVTAEVTAVKHVRTLLQRDFALNKATMHVQGYWIRGRAMGTFRDDKETRKAQKDAQREAQQWEDQWQEPSPQPISASGVAIPNNPTSLYDFTADLPPEEVKPRGVLHGAGWAIFIAGITQAILTILQVVPFILFAELARLFLNGANQQQFIDTAVVALTVLGAGAFGTSAMLLVLHLFDASFSAKLRNRLLRKLTRLPLGWYSDRDSSAVRKLVSEDVSGLHYLIVHAVPDLVAAIVAPLAVLVYLFGVDWHLGLVLLSPIIGYIIVMMNLASKEKDKMVHSQRMLSDNAGKAQLYLCTQEVSRVFGENTIVDFSGGLLKFGDFMDKWQHATGPIKVIPVLLNRPITVLTILLSSGWVFISAGWVSSTQLIPFLILGTSCGTQLIAISHGLGGLIRSLDSRAGLELFLSTPELAGRSSVDNSTMPPQHVHFDAVRFSYSPERTILPSLSLSLEPKTITALVGPSGAGKSTVAALLARLWDPQSGSISIDGIDLRDMSQDELYSQVTVMLQEVQLIHATVWDNIRLASPEATDEEAIAAAKAANIHNVIMQLPEGYDTILTNSRLSGGERQRIGIARALLSNNPIVILDEATASIDPSSEWEIREALSTLLKDKTVLMIAHRLHTIVSADRILVLDHGEIVQDGPHAELIEQDGLYASLWRAMDGANVS